MLATLLSVGLLGQILGENSLVPKAAPNKQEATREQIVDRVFCLAQEEFVYQSLEKVDLKYVITSEQMGLLAKWGSPKYADRQSALALFTKSDRQTLRTLFWGSKSENAEIRSRCKARIDTLFPCLHCLGSRICPKPDKKSFVAQCPSCHLMFRRTKEDYIDNLYHKGGCIGCFGTGRLNHGYNPIMNPVPQI